MLFFANWCSFARLTFLQFTGQPRTYYIFIPVCSYWHICIELVWLFQTLLRDLSALPPVAPPAFRSGCGTSVPPLDLIFTRYTPVCLIPHRAPVFFPSPSCLNHTLTCGEQRSKVFPREFTTDIQTASVLQLLLLLLLPRFGIIFSLFLVLCLNCMFRSPLLFDPSLCAWYKHMHPLQIYGYLYGAFLSVGSIASVVSSRIVFISSHSAASVRVNSSDSPAVNITYGYRSFSVAYGWHWYCCYWWHDRLQARCFAVCLIVTPTSP